jgi:uroporphyrinogen decarboxylase
MNSRERVQTVLEGKIPDRIPNGLGGCETTGLHVLAYDKLQEILGVEKTPPRLNTFMVNAVFEQEVLNRIEGDILLLASPNLCKSPLWGPDVKSFWKEQTLWNKKFLVAKNDIFTKRLDGTIVWETNRGIECPTTSYFFDSPEQTDFTIDFTYPSPKEYNPPASFDDKQLREWEELAKRMHNETEYSLCMGETITDLQIAPGGMIGSMILMLEEPEVMQEFLYKSLTSGLSQLVELDQAIGKYVDILLIAHDFGDNNGVTIGESLWREIYKPFYKELFTSWRQITNMKSNLHSCGSVYSILGDLVECGVDILNPIQTSATNMNAIKIKEEFGSELIFWGGAYDSQLFSKEESANEVYEKVSSAIRTLSTGGGYIFSGVHNLPPDMPKHHLEAMIRAWRDVRDYC